MGFNIIDIINVIYFPIFLGGAQLASTQLNFPDIYDLRDRGEINWSPSTTHNTQQRISNREQIS